MIGRGGSSKVRKKWCVECIIFHFIWSIVGNRNNGLLFLFFKVYQVFDHKKHVYAVKYVNLEEADAQAVESYKNEIEHLNHLQQYSDQIIKLYD